MGAEGRQAGIEPLQKAIAAGGPMSTMLRLVARLVETRLPACRVIVAVDPTDDHFAVAASSLDSVPTSRFG